MRTAAVLLLVAAVGVLIWDLWQRGAGAGQEALREIRRKQVSADPMTRVAAVRDLCATSGPAQIQLLLTAAGDPDERVGAQIEQSAGMIKDKLALDWLATNGLRFPDRWVRFDAALILARARGRESVPLLLRELKDNYWEVQWVILTALTPALDAAQIDSADFRSAVLPLLGKACHPRVRTAALAQLARGTGAATVDALLDVWRQTDPKDDPGFANALEEALAGLSGAAGVLAERAEKASSPIQRALAVRTLGRAGSEANLPLLLQILEKDAAEDLRIDALWAAVALGGKGLAPVAVPLLRTGGERLRVAVAAALATRLVPLDPPALEALAGLVKEQKPGPVTALLAGLVQSQKGSPATLAAAPWETEAAVEAAAAWLVRNQEPDGRWSATRGNPWHGHIGFPRLFGPDADTYYDPVTTGWAVLALLASGSDTDAGPHRDAARAGINWLLALQKPNGLFKSEKEIPPPSAPDPDYPRQAQYAWALNHLVPTLALVEAVNHNARNATTLSAAPESRPRVDLALKTAAAKAVDAIKDGGLPDEYDLFNKKTFDISKACLVAMIRYAWGKSSLPLKEALTLNPAAFKKTSDLLNELILSGTTTKVPFDFDGNYWFRSHAGNVQSIIGGILLSQKTVAGIPIDNFIDLRLESLRRHRPTWNPFFEIVGPAGHPPTEEQAAASDAGGSVPSMRAQLSAPWKDDIVDYNYWFHGTLATYLLGEDDWYDWNKDVSRCLLDHQRRCGEEFGSWEPLGPWSRVYGRSYATAMSTLALAMTRKNLSFSQVEWKRSLPYRPPRGNKPAPPPTPGGGGS